MKPTRNTGRTTCTLIPRAWQYFNKSTFVVILSIASEYWMLSCKKWMVFNVY